MSGIIWEQVRQEQVRGVRFAALAVALAAAGLFSSCRGVPLKEGVGITLDSEFEDWTRSTLKIDAQRFSELQLSVPERDPYFYRRIFKTADFSGAVAFIDERVDYLVAPGYFPARLVSRPVKLDLLGELAAPAYSESLLQTRALEASSEPELTTVAVNWGLLEWLIQEAFPLAPPRKLKINGKKLSALNSRAGWVQLDFGYFDDRIFPQRDGSETRLAILAHEARHSDCTGGLSDEDLEAFREGRPPLSYACGHRHGVCPEGHPLAGTVACDLHPWGAYAIGYSVAASLMAFCQDCSRYAQEELRLEAIESLSRVVLTEEMLSGKLPPIDLTSEGRIGSRP